jgi:glycosyltransferase involved in cell wall biosynthesis
MEHRRLSIAVIPAWYPTSSRPLDGIFVRDHARAAALGSDVAVLVDDGSSPSLRRLYALDDTTEGEIRTFRIRYPRSRVPQLTAAGYLLGVLAALRRLRYDGRPVDLLHAHVHRAAWAATIVGTVARLPVVVSEHSSEFGWSGIGKGALRRARIAFARADLVCPVSDYLRRQIEANGIRASFRVVPNAVDTELFSPAPASKARGTGRARLIAVAALHVKKGLSDLLEALGRLAGQRRDFVLDLVGAGPCREEYVSLVRRLGIADMVVFHGLQPRPAVASLMQQADFLVLPSLTENLPVAVIEAMACGLPVVATRVGGVPELVDERTGLLVEAGSPRGLCRGVAHMLDHHGDYPREDIVDRARSRYSLAAVGRTWSDVYRGVGGG